MNLFNALGGRKLAACLIVLVVAVAVTVLKGELPSNLADMLKYLITAYIGGNVGSDLAAALGNKVSPDPTTSVALTNTDVEHIVAKAVSEKTEGLAGLMQVKAEIRLSEIKTEDTFKEVQEAIGNLALSVQGIQNSVQYVIERVPPKASPSLAGAAGQSQNLNPNMFAPMGQQQAYVSPPRRVDQINIGDPTRVEPDFSNPVSFKPNPGMANMLNPFNNIPPLSQIDPALITNQNPLG